MSEEQQSAAAADAAQKEEESLQLQAYEAIRHGIIYNDYAPGDKLMVKNLCADFNMGRTPIREALVRLRQENLVETIPQSGTYVSKIRLDAVECARYVRERMERQIAVEACARASVQDLAGLRQIIDEQKAAYEREDRKAFFDGDNLFHFRMYEIAGRTHVSQWIDFISIDLQRFRWLRVQTEELDWQDIISEHEQILGAIEHTNTDEVDWLVSRHLHLLFEESAAIIKRFPTYFTNAC